MIRPSSKENTARYLLVLAGDFLLAWAILALAVFIRRTVPLLFTRSLLPETNFAVDGPAVLLFAGSFIVALALSGFYRRRVMPRERPMILMALVIQVALITTASAFSERPVPRSILIGVAIMEAVALPAWRFLLRIALPIRPRETVLVGDARQVRAALDGLEAARDVRIRVIAWAGPGNDSLKIPHLGASDDPLVASRLHDAEEVIYARPEATPQERLELLRIRGPRGYLLLASHADALLTRSSLGWVGDQPLIEIAVHCGYGIRAVVKRLMDATLACVLAIAAAPLMIAVAVAIWIDDRRPVLIRQLRVGRGGIPFAMWKFRSMHVPRNGGTDGETITRVGALIRRYRIDELPQLINIIVGDMSLVGPRPERPEMVAEILRELPEFSLRSLVRPGLAGLAQVSGKYDSRPEVKLRYDLAYMCDWSLALDLRLLLSSVAASLSGSGR